MKKRVLALILASAMIFSLAACGSKDAGSSQPAAEAKPVELNVTTTFAGEDGNAQNFKSAVEAWCA